MLSGYPPPRPPHGPDQSHSWDYINGSTYTWMNAGIFSTSKGFVEPQTINLDTSRGVTEVRLAAIKAPVRIVRAYAITASGEYLELSNLQGDVGEGGVRTVGLSPRYAIRLQKLVLEMASTRLIGSRGQLEVVIGLTR